MAKDLIKWPALLKTIVKLEVTVVKQAEANHIFKYRIKVWICLICLTETLQTGNSKVTGNEAMFGINLYV